ncbi:hypothetical protein Efla_005168 [Eimeria flavescens]
MMAAGERGASSVRRSPKAAAVVLRFLLVTLVSGALCVCLRASHSASPLNPEESSYQSSSEREKKGGTEKWFLPFLILLAFVIGAALAILIIHIANMRSLRKREAVTAQEAAPELFEASDNDSPTPRDRRGIWES